MWHCVKRPDQRVLRWKWVPSAYDPKEGIICRKGAMNNCYVSFKDCKRISMYLSEDEVKTLKQDCSGDITWYNTALVNIRGGAVASTGIVDIYVIKE